MGADVSAKIELDGERAYREQMRQITQQTKTMRAETTAMESAWNKSTTAQQKAAQQTKQLNEQIKQQKDTIKTAEANVEKLSAKYGENDRRTLQWRQKLAEARTELNRLESALANVPNKIQLVGQAMQRAGDKMKAAGEKMSAVGSTLTRTVTVPLAAIGGASVKFAMEFETAMAKVSTIADESEVSMADMGTAITNLSNETGVAATDIAESVYQAISAGQDTGKAVDFVTQSTKLAKAGFTDASTSVDLLTTILNAYGMQAEEVTNVSDMLIQTQNKGKTTIAQLGSSMGQVIPTAAAFNVGLEQVASAYVTLTKNGIDTAIATTALNGLLSELGKQGSKSATILEQETGKSFSDLMAEGYSLNDVLAIVGAAAEESGVEIGAMFSNQRAMRAARSLTQNANDFTDALDSMASSAGSTQAAFDKVTDTSAEQFKRILNELRNTGIDLGQSVLTTLAPSIQKVAGVIKDGTKWFAQLDDKTKENIVKFGLLAAAVGPVLSVTGKLVSATGSLVEGGGKAIEWVGKMIKAHGLNAAASAADASATTAAATATELLNAAFIASPIGTITLAITALVAGIVALKKGYENAKQAALEENEALAQSVSQTEKATSAMEQAGSSIKSAYDDANYSIGEVMATSQRATVIISDIEKLNKVEDLNADQKRVMQGLVAELNSLYPGLNAEIDENTGKTKQNTAEIRNLVDESARMQKIEIYNKIVADSTDALAEAYKAKAMASFEAAKAEEYAKMSDQDRAAEIQRLQEKIKGQTGSERELTQVQLNMLSAQGGTTLAHREAQEAIDAERKAEEELSKQIEDYEGYLGSVKDTLELTDQDLADYNATVEENTDLLGEAGEATEDLIDETGELGEEYGDTADEISDASKQIIDAYTSTRDSAQQSVMDQKGLFEELEAAEEVSIDSMIAGLQSHIDAYSNWNSNMEELMSSARYQTDTGFRAMVNSIASAGIESAPKLEAITTAFREGDARLEEIVDGYGNMQSVGFQTSEYMAFATTEAQYGINDMAQAFAEGGLTLEGAAGEMIASASAPLVRGDLKKAALDEARMSIDGMSTTLNSGEPSAAMTSALARMEKENAKPATAAGENIAGNVGEGMTDGSGEIAAGGDAMSSEVQSTLTEVGAQASQAQSDGSEIAKAMAQGINGSKPLVIAAMNAVKTAISTSLLQIRGLSSTAKTNGQGISNSLRDGINAGKSGVQTAMDGLKTAVTTALDGLSSASGTAKTAGQNIGSNLAAGINANAGSVSTAASNLASNAKTPLESLQNSSNLWGQHLIQNFVTGMEAKRQLLANTAQSLAREVSSRLEHTTPKEGPLKNDDVWGLHLGQNFAAGMIQAIPIVEAAANQMASAAVLDTYADIGMLSGKSEPLTADMMFDAFSAALREADMNVYIGNREFKRVLRENGAIA